MGWSWRNWLKQTFFGGKVRSLVRSRNRTRKNAARAVQLYMEALEERTVPAGVWTPLAHNASIQVGTMEVLPNGDVVGMDDTGNTPGWVELTPSALGS